MRVAKVKDSLLTARKVGIQFSAIIDVGIQDGTPVLIEVFPELRHHLFEPVDEFHPKIRQNYRALSYELVRAAVSDTDGEIILKTEKKTRGDQISHAYISQSESEGSRRIPSVRLDSYFAGRPSGSAYLLKIDVEGPDVPTRILKGAREVLRDTGMVMIEMTVDKFMERAVVLHEAGFDLWDLCDLCYYGDCLWQADALFVRRDLKVANMALRPMHTRPFRKELWQSGF